MAADTVPTPAPAVRQAELTGYRRTLQTRQIIIWVILGLGALAMIVPFEWMIATSFSRLANQSMPRIPRLWPADPSLFNYEVAVRNLPILRYYANSLFVTAVSTVGYLFFSSLTGYVFAKGRFIGKPVLFVILLMTLMVPFEVRMIPLYLFMRKLDLTDTYWALILPFLSGGFGMFLMRQYMTTIPDDLVDAARVDGAHEFDIYWRVMLPLCGPPLAALAVRNALWRWNDVLWPLMVISNSDYYTVTLGLATASRQQGILTGVALANTTLAILPIALLYIVLQRFIIRGIAYSGLKG